MDRTEDEVRIAEIESRLRSMVLELTKPTIQQTTRLQSECRDLQEQVQSHGSKLQAMVDDMRATKERTDLVVAFKWQLDQFWERQRELEVKLGCYQKETLSRIETAEKSCENSNSLCARLGRTVDRTQEDMDSFVNDVRRIEAALDMGIQRNKEHIDAEVRRVDICVKEMKDMHHSLAEEIWGPEDPLEVSPPSLRRLDMQAKRTASQLTKVLTHLSELRRLDQELGAVKQEQTSTVGQLQELTTACNDLREKVAKIAQDTKQDTKRVSNMMAAYTANLMHDVRGSFTTEVKALQEMQQEVENVVRGTEATVARLDEALQSTARQVEAAVREVRVDIDGLELKRKRDRQGLEEGIQTLQERARAALKASESSLRGLEHISTVLGMSLQSERMSIAMDVQDYIERKEMPLVGLRKTQHRTSRGQNGYQGARVKPGLDPEQLVRLLYQPDPVPFQGTAFERSQLIALREKLVHFAQEALQQGPTGSAAQPGDGLPSLRPPQQLVSQALTAQVPTARRASPASPASDAGDFTATHASAMAARPGSRGQPSARGSPLPEGDVDWQTSARRRGPTPPLRIDGSIAETVSPIGRLAEADVTSATHLPSLSRIPVTAERAVVPSATWAQSPSVAA